MKIKTYCDVCLHLIEEGDPVYHDFYGNVICKYCKMATDPEATTDPKETTDEK